MDHVTFDTSFLKIKTIVSGGSALKYTLSSRQEPYGSALTIQLPKKLKKEDTTEIVVEYETTDACTAVQWLNPEQTFGGKHPFMYIQRNINLGSRNVRLSMHDHYCLVKTHPR